MDMAKRPNPAHCLTTMVNPSGLYPPRQRPPWTDMIARSAVFDSGQAMSARSPAPWTWPETTSSLKTIPDSGPSLPSSPNTAARAVSAGQARRDPRQRAMALSPTTHDRDPHDIDHLNGPRAKSFALYQERPGTSGGERRPREESLQREPPSFLSRQGRTRQRSSKKSAATTAPAASAVGGDEMSRIAQSGSFGFWSEFVRSCPSRNVMPLLSTT